MKRKLVALLLTGVMSFATFSACTAKNQSAVNISALATVAEEDVDFWGAVGTEKILKDVSKSSYSAFVQAAMVDLTMAKGEYEGAQIIMTPTKDVDYYNVTVGEIKSANNVVFPADHIEVLMQKYIYVGKVYDDARNPKTGWYPDALLPFDAAKTYKENKIKAGENQGLYFSFETPLDLPADTYTGMISIDYGNFQKEIPVNIKVMELTVSEEPHFKSIFLDTWQYFSGELQSGNKSIGAYHQALIKYRLAPDQLGNYSTIEEYVERAVPFLRQTRCSNITLPYVQTTVNNETTIVSSEFANIIIAFARRSFADNFNYVAKLVAYFGIIDEPQHSGLLNRVKQVSSDFRAALNTAASTIANDTSITSPLKNKVVEDIRNIRNVVTCAYADSYAPYVDTWCPQFSYYDDGPRSRYDNQAEKWWYGCISPRTPYPTYHTEDIWLSNRVMGWMQAKYNVVGNLFWAVNIYAAYDGEQYNDIEDYYGLACRFPQVNGDGYLFYPGGQYGLDEPVGSIRLVATRDGIEEYELLYALKEKYAALSGESGYSFTSDSVMNSLTKSLFSGAKVTATSEDFGAAREELLQLASCAQSEAGFAVTKYTDSGSGVITYEIFMKKGYTLKKNNVALTPTSVTGGNKYTVSVNLQTETQGLHLSFECNGKTYKYDKGLGGEVTITNATDFKDGFKKDIIKPTVSVVSSVAFVDKSVVKLEIPETSSKYQRFALADAKISQFNPVTSIKAVFRVYYEGDEDTSLTVYVKYQNVSTLQEFTTGIELKHNQITQFEMNLATLNAGRIVEYLSFRTGNTKNEPARTLYFIDMAHYAK